MVLTYKRKRCTSRVNHPEVSLDTGLSNSFKTSTLLEQRQVAELGTDLSEKETESGEVQFDLWLYYYEI